MESFDDPDVDDMPSKNGFGNDKFATFFFHREKSNK